MFNRNYLTGAKLLREKYLIICKCNKGKSPERFGDEDIYHFSVLAKELPQFISSHVLCTTPNKHLSASQRLIWALLRIWKFTVTPSSIYHMSLWHYFHLGFIFREANEAKPFWMTSFNILLDLEKKSFKFTKSTHTYNQPRVHTWREIV